MSLPDTESLSLQYFYRKEFDAASPSHGGQRRFIPPIVPRGEHPCFICFNSSLSSCVSYASFPPLLHVLPILHTSFSMPFPHISIVSGSSRAHPRTLRLENAQNFYPLFTTASIECAEVSSVFTYQLSRLQRTLISSLKFMHVGFLAPDSDTRFSP